eukprot:scaffold335_cov253-Pinguiococcus_pyrenoidosus.AAC.4
MLRDAAAVSGLLHVRTSRALDAWCRRDAGEAHAVARLLPLESVQRQQHRDDLPQHALAELPHQDAYQELQVSLLYISSPSLLLVERGFAYDGMMKH